MKSSVAGFFRPPTPLRPRLPRLTSRASCGALGPANNCRDDSRATLFGLLANLGLDKAFAARFQQPEALDRLRPFTASPKPLVRWLRWYTLILQLAQRALALLARLITTEAVADHLLRSGGVASLGAVVCAADKSAMTTVRAGPVCAHLAQESIVDITVRAIAKCCAHSALARLAVASGCGGALLGLVRDGCESVRPRTAVTDPSCSFIFPAIAHCA
jgi:hypothetical protein